MAKYYGKIGYVQTYDDGTGVWKTETTEKYYSSDRINFTGRYSNGDKVYNDISVNSKISIIADLYALDHLGFLKYAELQGLKWTVESIESVYPRLILTLGGLYHDPEAEDS